MKRFSVVFALLSLFTPIAHCIIQSYVDTQIENVIFSSISRSIRRLGSSESGAAAEAFRANYPHMRKSMTLTQLNWKRLQQSEFRRPRSDYIANHQDNYTEYMMFRRCCLQKSGTYSPELFLCNDTCRKVFVIYPPVQTNRINDMVDHTRTHARTHARTHPRTHTHT